MKLSKFITALPIVFLSGAGFYSAIKFVITEETNIGISAIILLLIVIIFLLLEIKK